MIRGGCLCGGIRFEVARAVGPFELCHCNRCRKASGSAFVPWLGVLREDFRLLQGEELIRRYEAPLRDKPPPYRTCFCGRCGSPVPDPEWDAEWLEVHAAYSTTIRSATRETHPGRGEIVVVHDQ
jgi:hypothetical protein